MRLWRETLDRGEAREKGFYERNKENRKLKKRERNLGKGESEVREEDSGRENTWNTGSLFHMTLIELESEL